MAVLFTAQAHAEEPLSLDVAVATALKNHPQILEAKANLAGAEARSGQAFAGYYPQVRISSDWSKGRSYFPVKQSTLESDVTTAALSAGQTIYDFGRTAGAVEAAGWNRSAALDALAVTRQDVLFRVRNGFYLLLAAGKQVDAVNETVLAREAVFRQAQEFFKEGLKAKVDVARAEANLYAARTSLIRAQNNRDLARVELANALGIASLGERKLVAPQVAPAEAPELAAAQMDALANRPELKRLGALENSAQASLKTAKSGFLPVLSATASFGYADRDLPPSGNVWGVGVNLTVPLLSGFATVEQVKEAVALRSAVAAQQEGERLQVAKEVEAAWLGVREAGARMVSTEKEVAAADESKALAEGRYQEGVGNIIEVTDAQSQALEARTAQIQALYDYQIALARMDRAVGKD
ncbi:TolC family protein [Geomonas oryzae]|uniref:TolC family protein n=1 Tax=Geomonas oryzae TaxID=2364273 RepID=UPI00100BDEC0|nr:TolC family protein [Geomonas oryzae]